MSMPFEFLGDGLSVLMSRYDRAGKHEGIELQIVSDIRRGIDTQEPLAEDIAKCQKLLEEHEITESVVHALYCRDHLGDNYHPQVKSYCEKLGVTPPPFPLEIITKADQKQTDAAIKLLADKAWWDRQLRRRARK